jgi:Cu-Zn family superoxide dismutase
MPSKDDEIYASGNPDRATEPTKSTMPPDDQAMPSDDTSAKPATSGTGTPGATEPAPTVATATAQMKSIKDGTPMGTVTFERNDEGQIVITGEFTGLKKNSVHALYIHENGDCSNKGKKVGAHLNPTKAKHGVPSSSVRHAGDFGNVTADDSGTATFSMTTDSVTMEADRPDSILNRAVVLHSKKDDKKGSAGTPLACGVIQQAAE